MSVLKKKAAHIDDRKKCLSLELLVQLIDPNRSKLRCQGRATEVNLSLSLLIRLELDSGASIRFKASGHGNGTAIARPLKRRGSAGKRRWIRNSLETVSRLGSNMEHQ